MQFHYNDVLSRGVVRFTPKFTQESFTLHCSNFLCLCYCCCCWLTKTTEPARHQPQRSYTVNKTSEVVKIRGTALATVPAAMSPALTITPTLSPLAVMSQHIGVTKRTKVMVPQLAIIATVFDPQRPGKAAFTLSLRGPHVFH